MGEFVGALLGEVLELKRGYDLPQQDRAPGMVPIVSSSGITAHHSKAMVRGPGVITGRYGTLGKVFYVTEDFWPLNTTLYVRDFKGNDPRFIFYFLRSLDFDAYSDKAAVPGLNRNHLHMAHVRYPDDVGDQRAIASTLGVLDDKIETNRRMNETLEAMARTIFKDWFIDFGPTRAKMEGRAPYLAPEIWSLFPGLLDNEGKPQGWKIAPLRRLGGTAIGGYWGDDQPADEEAIQFICLRGVDLEHLRLTGSCPEAPVRWGKSLAVSKRPITEYDVLVAGSGAGPCGRSLWISNHASGLRSLPITYSNFVKRISCSSPAAACFLDQVLHEMRLSGEIWSYVNGTSVPNLNDQGLLDGKSIVMPDERLLIAFMEHMQPIHAKLFNHENVTLAATRDLLLPKLMSGEIRVRDAEKVAEAAQ